MRTLQHVYGDDHKAVERVIIDRAAAVMAKHPRQNATKRYVALHEAGHYLAFEAEGMVAGTAEIYGSPFGRDGWSGTAGGMERPVLNPWPAYDPRPCTPDELLSEARVTLAGAWAESLFGDGDFFGSIGEILEAHFMIARAAEILGRDPHQVLDDVVAGTAAIVDVHATEIEDIATQLERRGGISRYRRKTGKILLRVRRTPEIIRRGASKSSIERLRQLVAEAVPDIDRLITQVTTPEDASRARRAEHKKTAAL